MVFDTGSVAQVCNAIKKLTRSRRLAKGEVNIRVGNKASVATLSVGVYLFQLSRGLIMELDNCYFIPSLSRKIISSSFYNKMVLLPNKEHVMFTLWQ